VKIPPILLARIRKSVVEYIGQHPPTRTIENPDGGAYLDRWELRGNHPVFDIYLHRFMSSDDSRALHDHPGASVAIILRGRYTEWFKGGQAKVRSEGDVVVRRAAMPHRIEINPEAPPVLTLFLRGPKLREWGFYCSDGWRHNREFRSRGCEP